ncbi:MAG: hypothetical protein LBT97_12235 [Planctomycetota bacterium]|jgi:hypothetical protein|nr:hypothetical protein [Planctomycetota bacterium]
MSGNIGNFNIRTQIMGAGLNGIENTGAQLAKNIENTDAMNQADLIKLQQQVSVYNNTISMMSTMLKSLGDTDKEVIRAM